MFAIAGMSKSAIDGTSSKAKEESFDGEDVCFCLSASCLCCCCRAASAFNWLSLGGIRITNVHGLSSNAVPEDGRGDACSRFSSAAIICREMLMASTGMPSVGSAFRMPLMAEVTGASRVWALLLVGDCEDIGLGSPASCPFRICGCM